MRKRRFPSRHVLRRKFWRLVTNPIFLFLSLVGNLLVVSSTFALYYVEAGVNPQVRSMLDALWWAVSTVTTVGYGDVVPVTDTGKAIGMILMITGIALFWSFTALFAEALVSEELGDFESELRAIEMRLKNLRTSSASDDDGVQALLSRIEKHLIGLGKS